MSTEVSSIKIPKEGTQAFYNAVERLKNAPANCTNSFDLATECCKLCRKTPDCDCESCFVQTVGDLADPFRKQIQKGTPTGMYTSGIYRDKDGKYHYTHPQGSD